MQTAFAPSARGWCAEQSLSEAWAPPRTPADAAEHVRVFDEHPGLLGELNERTAAVLRRRVLAPRISIDAGPWRPPSLDELPAEPLALLVLRGQLLRTIDLDGRLCPELGGAGDVIQPWQSTDGSIDHETSWTALEGTTVAVLDARFGAIACRWPAIATELIARTTGRSRALALHLAIAHVRHADLRLHMLLWHLADRWGRVTLDGVHLPLRLTHDTLAQLACMRRPTASSAVQRLARAGEVRRRADGTWMLTGSPPAPSAAGHAGGGTRTPKACATGT